MDKREFLFSFLGRETVSPAAKKAADGVEDLGDKMSDTERDAKKLDEQIDDVEKSLKDLATQYARTGDESFVKQIRAQERELRKLNKVKMHLPKLEPPPPPEPEEVKRWGMMFAAKLGPVIVSALPSALSAGGGVGAAVGAPIVAGLATFLAASGNAAILGAAAAGAVAGGVSIAAGHPKVQAAAATLSDSLGAQLEEAAAPFVPATIKAIGKVKAGFRDLDGDLNDIFSRSAGYVEPLVDGIMGFVREAVPGFRAVVRAAAPVVEVLKDELPELGKDVADAMTMLSRNAGGAAAALGLMLDIAGAGLKTIAQAVSIASAAFKYADMFASSFKGGAELGKTVAGYTNAAEMAKSGTTDWSDALKGLGSASSAAAVEVRSLSDAVDEIVGKNLTAAEAQIRLAEAAEAASESLDGKKRVTRDEQSALIDLAHALNDNTTAMDEVGRSAQEAAEDHKLNRSQLIAAAEAAGYTKKQARALAEQWLKVPKNVGTTVSANTKSAQAKLNTVRNTLDALDGKVANASVYISAYNKSAGPGDRREHGGPVQAGHAYIVGEKRPEVFVPDRDGRILPSVEEFNRRSGAGSSYAMAAHPGMQATSQQINVALSAGTGGGLQELVRLLMPYLRVEVSTRYGGNLTRAWVTG